MELKREASEAALLKEILERFLGNLRMEAGKTENYAMRQELKAGEEVVRPLIARL